MIIRFISETERDQWQMLFKKYAEFYETDINESIVANVWQWIIDPEKDFDCLVAVDNDKLVGFMHFYSIPSPLRGKAIGFLNDLYVAEEHRGNGVFDALFEKLAEIARSRGWAMVRWNTAEANTRARAAYERISNLTHWKVYQLNTSDT